MNRNKDLACSGYLEQPKEARNTPSAGPEDAENLAAFARRLGVNRSTVTRAAQAGRLVLTADGRVCIAASLQRWHATRAGREDVAQRHADARGAAIPSADLQNALQGPISALVAPATDGATPDPAAETRAHAAALTVHWQNQLLMLELGAATGAQLPREALLAEFNGLGAALRGGLERLVDQLSPRLAAASGAQASSRLIQAEVRHLRRQITREFPRALRRLTPNASAPLFIPTETAQEPSP
ncbi:hypothetical protein LNV47_22660 [Paucibacter sp. DJ4R-1]|nr:hypothetical protein [Paucibacter sp. DJ4R-1]